MPLSEMATERPGLKKSRCCMSSTSSVCLVLIRAKHGVDNVLSRFHRYGSIEICGLTIFRRLLPAGRALGSLSSEDVRIFVMFICQIPDEAPWRNDDRGNVGFFAAYAPNGQFRVARLWELSIVDGNGGHDLDVAGDLERQSFRSIR